MIQKFKLVGAAFLLVLGIDHAAAAGLSPTEAMDEFSSESAACAAYYSITLHCFSESGQLKGEAKANQEKIRDAAIKRLYETGKAAGVSDQTSLARFQMAMKSLMDDADKSCVNIAVLINRYGASCKLAIENPVERFDQIIKNSP